MGGGGLSVLHKHEKIKMAAICSFAWRFRYEDFIRTKLFRKVCKRAWTRLSKNRIGRTDRQIWTGKMVRADRTRRMGQADSVRQNGTGRRGQVEQDRKN